jgi:subtilisin family serine protease
VSASGGGGRAPDGPGPREPERAGSAVRRAIGSCGRALRSWVGGIGPVGRVFAAVLLLGGIAGAIGLAGLWQEDPERRVGAGAVRAVPGEYVVTFGGGVAGVTGPDTTPTGARRIQQAVADSRAAEAAAVAAGAKIRFRYRVALVGFSGTLPPAALRSVSRATGGRAHIERNWQARQASAADGFIGTANAAVPPPMPPQGLDRVGQRLLQLDQVYKRPTAGSRKVHVFVIDSGYLKTHSEFSSRVGQGGDAVSGSIQPNCLNHGTHVAGIIAGRNYGVASAAELHSVRVIDCWDDVTTDRVIAAVDWVGKQYLKGLKPAVANMSLQFNLTTLSYEDKLAFETMDVAIGNIINLGVPFVVAAGNNGIAACDVSPARIPMAITVGSTDPENDESADTSNYGSCVDLSAPGKGIVSATAKTNNAWAIGYGTSSAAPHVAGVAALVLSRPTATPIPGAVWTAIYKAANKDARTASGTPGWCGVGQRVSDTPDILLHWGAGSTDGIKDSEPDPKPPLQCEPPLVPDPDPGNEGDEL